jgi:uncharacterized repeat protein (TIGR01451 family)
MGKVQGLRWRGRRNRRAPWRPGCELMERRQLLSTYVVSNTNDDGSPNSLRWAILQANAASGVSTIAFGVTGPGPLAIRLGSALPAIARPVIIDGTTQPGYQGAPLVEIDGSGLGAGSDGLVLTAGNSTVRGLSVVGFPGSAIVLTSGGGDVIAGNYLGVALPGTTANPNGQGLAIVGSSGNTIGPAAGGAGNVISGNTGDGIQIQPGAATASGNLIIGNLIGTTADGSAPLGNGQSGIAVVGCPANQIGAAVAGLGNVISANLGTGISLTGGSGGTQIVNNLIGVAADQQTPLGNGGDGILLRDAPGSQVGDNDGHDGNVIGCNQGNGITTAGNTTGLVVLGNAIGTDRTGGLDLGNVQSGVTLGSSSNTIGGTVEGAGNVIAFNGSGQVGAGVQLVGSVDHDAILSNSIFSNTGLGINLGNPGSGPAPNHALGTPGPNDYQNYPVLTLAQSDGGATTIQGSLSESPNTSYLIQIFASPAPDPSGYGQGKVVLGSITVTTDDEGNATFTVPISSGASPGQSIAATATDPAGNTSEFSADATVQGQIDLQLTASATPDPVPAGGQVTYTLRVANSGTIAADGVILSDQLPASVTLVGTTVTQGYVVPTLGGGTVRVNLQTIPAGSAATVTIVVTTGADSVGTITDTASVSSVEPDPNPGDESAMVATTVQASTDIAITLHEDPNPALVGGELSYTMTVSNLGPAAAGDVVATLPVAAGAAFVSASSSVGGVTVPGAGAPMVVAHLGPMAAGAQARVNVVLRALAAGDLTETATVSSDDANTDPSGGTASVTTTVLPAADLSVAIAASAQPVVSGQAFQYIVTATNAGPLAATGVVLSDILPAGVDFLNASADQGVVPVRAGGLVSATFATLAMGASARLVINVDAAAPPGSLLHDTATVAGQQADPNGKNNAAALDITVRGVSDLGVAATARPASPSVGQPLTYTISVTNQGPADEPDAVLTGALAAGVTFDSGSSTRGGVPTVSGGIVTADLGPLPAMQTAVVTLIVTPGPAAVGAVSARFAVQGQDLDPVLTNNTAEVTVNVAPSADLAVGLAPSSSLAIAQVDWTYTVVVSNAGPSDATGVTAVSPLPADVELVSAVSSQGPVPTDQDGAVTAVLGAIAAGHSATVTVVVRPTPAAATAGSIGLAATVAGDESDPVPGNNRASLQVAVAPSASLALSLAAAPQALQSGQTLTITAMVSNTGTTPATDIVLNLPAAAGLTCDSWSASQGTMALVAGQLLAQIGALDPGTSATMTVQESATVPGTVTQSATVAAAEYNLDPQGSWASTTATVIESPGVVQFGAGTVVVTEKAGVAAIPVVRLDGAAGTITVAYQTVALNATPGRDFVAAAGTLVLGPGQTTATIPVTVLADPYDNHDELVQVGLTDPTGGAALGGVTTTLLRIQDIDPDFTPPQVSGLTWSGRSRWVTSLTLSFTAPLDPASASNPANYRLINLAAGRPVAIGSITYNPATDSVTIVPASPLRSGQYDQIQVIGAGPTAVRDLAGNLLDGAGSGAPGSNYAATFAQGTQLRYRDNAGNRVTLRLRGPGYLRQVLSPSGQGISLDVVGMVAHRTTLTGSLRRSRAGSGQTDLGTIEGLGQFGDVLVLLKTPPFLVSQLPFQRRNRSLL